MNKFNNEEFKLYKKILGMSQKGLLYSMDYFLHRFYKKILTTNKYICAEGDVPVIVCAHLDTVFSKPPVNIFYDREENVIWSPDGAGHDDRAGIFMIMKLIGDGYRPHIILSTDEEQGCLGAAELAKLDLPFPDSKYIIQLDRRGAQDCVFYWGDNRDFIHYVESFGFVEAKGSFTDIVEYCPAWEICGTNLSVGYYNEHSQIEYLKVGEWYNTYFKVRKMLENPPVEKFIYTETKTMPLLNPYGFNFGGYGQCAKCKGFAPEEDLYRVKRKSNGKMEPFCIDCMMEGVNWCDKCNQPFECDNPRENICDKCKGEINGARSTSKDDSGTKD